MRTPGMAVTARHGGVAVLVLGLLLGTAGPVQAGLFPIVIDGGWKFPLNWHNAPGTFWEGGPWEYNSSSWTSLKVTDGYWDGDRFEVYDGGSLLGTASVPSTGDWVRTTTQAAWDAVYADPRWSSGEWLLGPGDHSITVKTFATIGWLAGTGALRVDTSGPPPSAVPVPGAAMLGVIGLALAGSLNRRRIK